jgi:hypothetical protein
MLFGFLVWCVTAWFVQSSLQGQHTGQIKGNLEEEPLSPRLFLPCSSQVKTSHLKGGIPRKDLKAKV